MSPLTSKAYQNQLVGFVVSRNPERLVDVFALLDDFFNDR